MFSTASAADACVDGDDQSKWNGGGKENFSTDLGEAVKGCVLNPNKSACVDQFYTKKYEYTEECTDCFGAIGECTIDHCLGKCIAGVNPDCKKCIGDNCGDSFTTCSGLKQAVMAPYADACMDTKDQDAWNGGGKENFSTDLGEAVKGCVLNPNKSACVDQFYTKKYEYTEECTDCFGVIGECTIDHCLGKCIAGVNPDCKKCIGDNCGDSFTTCSGLKQADYNLNLRGFFKSIHAVRPSVKKLFRKKAIKVWLEVSTKIYF